MGVIPCEFIDGQTAESLGLDGKSFEIKGIADNFAPGKILQVKAGDKYRSQGSGRYATSS